MQPIKTEKLFKLLKRYKYLLIVIAAGIVLLLWPSGGGGGKDEPKPPQEISFSLADMERRLTDALSSVEGVGRAEVMLTLRSDTRIVLQEDTNTQIRGENDTQSSTKTVLSGSGSDQHPIVIKRIYPEYEGAAVICDGADNALVRLAVINAVSSLTGLGSDRIAVLSRTQKNKDFIGHSPERNKS